MDRALLKSITETTISDRLVDAAITGCAEAALELDDRLAALERRAALAEPPRGDDLGRALELLDRFDRWADGWCPNHRCCARGAADLAAEVKVFVASVRARRAVSDVGN